MKSILPISLAVAVLLPWLAAQDACGAEWSVAVRPGVPSGIAYQGEGVSYEFTVSRGDAGTKQAELQVAVEEFGGETVTESRTLDFSGPSASVVLPISTERCGYYVLKVRVYAGEKEVTARETALAVVMPLADAGGPSPGSFFGSMFIRDAAAAQRLGIRCERSQAVWEWLSPAEGTYTWEKLDARVADMAQHGIATVLVVRPEFPPKWAEWKSPEQLLEEPYFAKYLKFIDDLAVRYRDRVAGFEIINEPDLEVRRGAQGSMAPAEVYARLLQAAADRIREVAPGVPVLGLDVSGVDFPGLRFSRDVLDLRPRSLDIMAGHPYTASRYLGADARAESPDAIDTVGRFRSMVELMRSHGLAPRVWATEFGWALHKDEALDSAPAQLLAAYIAQAISLVRTVPEVEKLFWFSTFFPGYEKGYTYAMIFGVPPDSYPTPGAAAYATCARYLQNVRLVRDIPLTGSARALRFEDAAAGQTVFVTWLREPQTVGGELKVALDGAAFPGMELCNALGRTMTGDWRVTALPLFARVNTADADRLEAALKAAPAEAREAVLFGQPYLAGADLIRVDVTNNTARAIRAKLFPVDQPQAGRSQAIPPGASTLEVRLAEPLRGRAELPLVVLEESSGKRRTLPFACTLLPMRAVAGVKIDGRLRETAGLAAEVRDTRDAVLPADPGVDWKGAQDLSMRVWTGWTPEGVYLAVRVRDDVATDSPEGEPQYWRHDSLQIGFDTGNRADSGYDASGREYGVFPTPKGAEVRENVPSQAARPDIAAAVRREKGETIYEVFFPAAALGVERLAAGQVLRLNVIANDNDGRERKCWVGLSPGIGEAKRPSVFPQWVLESPKPSQP